MECRTIRGRRLRNDQSGKQDGGDIHTPVEPAEFGHQAHVSLQHLLVRIGAAEAARDAAQSANYPAKAIDLVAHQHLHGTLGELTMAP